MFSIRPKRQPIKVRGRDKTKPLKEFKVASGHRVILHSGERAIKVVVRQTPSSGDRTFQGEVVAKKRPSAPSQHHKTPASRAEPPIGSMRDFTLANVFRVEV